MSSENASGLSKGAWLSLGIFGFLLVCVLATREESVEAGVRRLDLPVPKADEVSAIELKGPDLQAALVNQDGVWSVYNPEQPEKKFEADGEAVKKALEGLSELRAENFVTGRAEKHADLEIDGEKGLHVRVQGNSKSLDVVFGRSAKGGGNFIRLANSDDVFVGSGPLASALKKDVQRWRKRQLFTTKSEDIRQIEIAAPGKKPLVLVGNQAEGAENLMWSFGPGVALPADFRIDNQAIARIPSSFASLRANDFADDVDTSASGLATGAKITATLADGKKLTLLLGNEDEKKRVYAQIEGQPQVYLLSGYSAKSFLKEQNDFRDLTVIPFEANQVESVRVQGGGQLVELKKQEGQFVLVSPNPAPPGFELDVQGMMGKLSGIARTKGTSVALNAPANAVSNPEITVEVGLVGGETKKLVFGKKAPTTENGGSAEFFALGEGNLIYRVAGYQKSRFEKPLDLFKKVEAPPMPPSGGGNGLDSLPPDIRKQLEAAMRNQGM